MLNILSKSVSGLLVTIIIANSFMFAILFQPKQAKAQFTDPINAVLQPLQYSLQFADSAFEKTKTAKDTAVQTKTGLFEVWNQFRKNDGIIAGIVKSLLLMTMHQVLAKITNDTVAWINGGGKGKIRILQDPGKFLSDAIDEAGGVLAGQILGVDPASLCNADYLKYTLKAELTGPYAVPTFNEKVACTFSGAANGLRKFQEDFTNGGWTSFIELLDKPNNQMGQRMIVTEELDKLKTDSAALASGNIARNGGYLDQEKCTITKLPGWLDKNSPAYDASAPTVALEEKMDDVIKRNYSDYTETQFRTLWKSWGGDFNCKITTPAQNIKTIADKALQAPLDSINGWINGLTSGLGTDASSVLTPYLTAIGNATMNQILKKEKGLITDFLAQQSKPRQIRRQPTNTLQQNAQISQSTVTLVGSAKDFRSFLLASALEFSQFITTTGKFINEQDILGYQAINRYNYDANGAASGKTWDSLSMRGQIGPGDQGSQPETTYRSNASCNVSEPGDSICKPSTSLVAADDKGIPNPNFFTQTAGRVFFEEAKWCGAYFQTLPTTTVPPSIVATSPAANPIPIANQLGGGCGTGVITTVYNRATGANVQVCAATVVGISYTCPAGQSVIGKACSPNSITPLPAGCPLAVIVNNGIWGNKTYCAPLPTVPITLTTCPTSPIPGATSVCTDPSSWVQYQVGGATVMATRLIGYDDAGNSTSTETMIDRVVRQNIVGPLGINGIPGPIAGGLTPSAVNFTETIINTGRNENQNGGTDSVLQSLEFGSAAELQALFEMRPNFVTGISSGGNLPQGLAQTTTARTGTQTFVFGGYGKFGFSNNIYNSTGGYVGVMPDALAGAAAVYYPPNGRIYIFGGFNESGLSDKIYEYDPVRNQFRTMSAHLTSPSFGFSAAYFPNNQRIYLFGGIHQGVISKQIFEYNQTTDTLSLKNTTLPTPLAFSGAATVKVGTQNSIIIAGGEYGPSVFSSDIYQYNPLSPDSSALTPKSRHLSNVVAFPVVTNDPADPAQVKISGGQNGTGYSPLSWTYNAGTDGISAPNFSTSSVSKAGGNGTTDVYGGVSPWGISTNPGVKIYPEGDIYLIPGKFQSYPPLPPAPSTMSPLDIAQYKNDYDSSMAVTSGVRAISSTETFYQKYQSPKLEGASAFLLNHRQSIDYADPTGTIIDPVVLRKVNDNPNQTHLSPPFYPELYEKAQELMEKIRLINGYNNEDPNRCSDGRGNKWPNYYQASLADQLGAVPDDNPADNNPTSPSYQGSSVCEGYKGSINDVLTRYNGMSDIYQKLFAGLHDENSLESVDKDLKILSPEETNIRIALIGSRCPITQPSLTSSSADLVEKCPVLSSGEYNMSRRFIFQPDDTTINPTGLTTGFATNPFSGKKSTALAGVLNLEEMTTQLQTLPPDKNIIQLIRLRQIVEQLQIKPQPILKPDKSNDFIYPDPLTGVDTIQVSLPGYEKIQDWLNATSTPSGAPLVNQDIQDLISSYGYTTAKEAYPQISQELDNIFPTITSQVADKMKEVFLKRMELKLEEAQANAQHRLEKFVTYTRDMNPLVKYEAKGSEGAQLKRFVDDFIQIGFDDYVLQIDATEVFRNGGKKIDDFLGRKSDGTTLGLTNDQRNGIIGSAIYKIRTMAKFTGIDVSSDDFSNRLSHYTQQSGSTEAEKFADLDSRVRDALRDVAMYYQGIFNQTDASLTDKERTLIPKPGSFGCKLDDSTSSYYCDLTTTSGGIYGGPSRIYKDVKTQLASLSENFGDMVDEISKIRDEFQTAMTDAQTKKQDMNDITQLFSAMKDDYNQANACFGLQNPQSARWQPSKDVLLIFGAVLGGISLLALNALTGGAIINSIAGFFGFGKGAKRAAEEAQRRWQRAVDSCKNGFINYNKHLGQVADQFLCGKINPLYQDK